MRPAVQFAPRAALLFGGLDRAYLMLIAAPTGYSTDALECVGLLPAGNFQRATAAGFESWAIHPPTK